MISMKFYLEWENFFTFMGFALSKFCIKTDEFPQASPVLGLQLEEIKNDVF